MPMRRAVRMMRHGDLAAVGDQEGAEHAGFCGGDGHSAPGHDRARPAHRYQHCAATDGRDAPGHDGEHKIVSFRMKPVSVTSGTRRSASARSARSTPRKCQPKHAPGVGWIDDAVVPQPRGGVIGMTLRLVLRADRCLECFLLVRRPLTAGLMRRAAPCASTLAACSPPMTEMRAFGHIHRKRGSIGAPAHAVIARAETAADDDRELRHRGVATAVTILAPSLAMPPASYLRPTMKPVMFCRNTSGMPRWRTARRNARPSVRDFGKQDAVVGEDADRIAADMRETADQCRAVERA